MRSKTCFSIVLCAACAALAACSAEPETPDTALSGVGMAHEGQHKMELSDREVRDKNEAAAMLAERFAVKACGEADMMGRVKKTDAQGTKTVVLGFSASAECADEVQAAVGTLGFTETEPGVYADASSGEVSDRVFIQRGEDGSSAVVEWEAVQK